jgi:signal transduction histidine kinase/CheY-like chemotaxis protein
MGPLVSENREQTLRALVDSVSNQLCRAVDGDFDFLVTVQGHDETVDKLTMMVNFVLDAACRGLERVAEKTREARELEQANAAAEAASRAKSQFLANMSHEIRTPMTAIQGYADMLAEPGVTDAERLEAVETIRRNGAYLLNIINDILDISKIEAGRTTIALQPCSPFEVLQDVGRMMQLRAEEKQIALVVEQSSPLPERIRTDPTRLRQILINLVGNAIKFTSEGEVRVSASVLNPKGRVPRLHIDIADTGMGIPVEQREELFTPFSQADGSMSRRFGGTGLGLVISRRLARMLGGDVRLVSSEPGHGSLFRVTLETGPLANVPMLRLPPNPRHPTPQAPAIDHLEGDVLVAEDGADNRRLIKRMLERVGLTVTFVHDGEQAVKAALLAAERHDPYDVILMDLQMPRMDGYVATQRLRESGYTGKIIALTAHAMETERLHCLEVGCDGFETKPIDRQRLLETLRRTLDEVKRT